MPGFGRKILGLASAAAVGYYFYSEYSGCTYQGKEDLTGNVYILTGSTGPSVGKETAREFAKRGGTVILGAKNLDRCHQARQHIIASTEYKNREIDCIYLDLKSLSSIRKFVDNLPPDLNLKAVINAAETVKKNSREKTHDGLEKQMGVSHFGHFLLMKLLVEKYSSGSFRVLPLHYPTFGEARINLSDLNSERAYDPAKVYNQTKLATLLTVLEGSKRFSASKSITVNAVNPGMSNTELFRHYSGTQPFFVKLALQPLLLFLFTSPPRAAQAVVYAALSPDMEGVSGKFIKNCKVTELPINASEAVLAKQLWELTEDILGDPKKLTGSETSATHTGEK